MAVGLPRVSSGNIVSIDIHVVNVIQPGRFLNMDPKAQIDRHCTDVVENTRMHIVAQTGRTEINHSQRINGQDMVVQRIPIKRN